MPNSLHFQCLTLILLSGLLYHETTKRVSSQITLPVGCIQTEKEALLRFKGSLADPSGRLNSWVGDNCCAWNGVICNNRTGHVVKLKLRNPLPDSIDGNGATHSLGGKLKPSLLELKHLNHLDLSLNDFAGSRIPKFLGSLENLRYLNLSGASFSGYVPTNLANLSRLHYLDLNTNSYGSQESNLSWLTGLSSLKYLNLGGVDLSNAADYWLQAINMLPSLSELHLPACGLSKLPLSFPFLNLSSVTVLDLSNNGFNSSIPHWLFNISQLKYLDLSSNNLQGIIPEAVAGMTALQMLDLSENSFISGQLSSHLGHLCNLKTLALYGNMLSGDITEFIDGLLSCTNSSLESIDLGHNELEGFLPDSLGHLKNLKHLLLSENSFLGSIPDSIGNLSSLREFNLYSNKMKGTIPESLGRLSELVALDMSENSWAGVITEAHFFNLTNLKDLSISKYSLSPNLSLVFNVSPLWIPTFKLRFIKLRSCKVGPKFPAWLKNQDELHTVILRNAKISDTIPEWFWKLDLSLDELDLGYNQIHGRVPNSLKFLPESTVYLNQNLFEGPLPLWSPNVSGLYLSGNLFSGPIPPDIAEQMPILTDIDISCNFLTGTIPLSIGKLNSLTTLVFSNNKLTGKIPGVWNDLPFLYVLDLSNNSLSGKIPISLGSLSSLRFLMLNNNNLSGKIPSAFKDCTLIDTLDLGDNSLSGNIPAWLGQSIPSLRNLRLPSNSFYGTIPSELCSLSSLHIVDLANNNLSGAIPSCLGSLRGMATEHKSATYEGQLLVSTKGAEYLYLSNLYLVNSIDLSNNSLSGEIPDLANLSRLGTLNLSMNHLTGHIPNSIGSLHWLETLDLSRNQLSGPIPTGMSSSTFLAHLNLSYNNLSGQIPTNNQFGTLNDPSIYEGNPELCGSPLPTKCNRDNGRSPPLVADKEDENEDGLMLWFYMGMGPGFVAGFWVVCGTLIMKRSWRLAFFKFVDNMKDRLLLAVHQAQRLCSN